MEDKNKQEKKLDINKLSSEMIASASSGFSTKLESLKNRDGESKFLNESPVSYKNIYGDLTPNKFWGLSFNYKGSEDVRMANEHGDFFIFLMNFKKYLSENKENFKPDDLNEQEYSKVFSAALSSIDYAIDKKIKDPEVYREIKKLPQIEIIKELSFEYKGLNGYQEKDIETMTAEVKDIVSLSKSGNTINHSLPISEFLENEISLDINNEEKSLNNEILKRKVLNSINENPIQSIMEIRFAEEQIKEMIDKRKDLLREERKGGTSEIELEELERELEVYESAVERLEEFDQFASNKINKKIESSSYLKSLVSKHFLDKHGQSFLEKNSEKYDNKKLSELKEDRAFIDHFNLYLKSKFREEYEEVAASKSLNINDTIDINIKKQQDRLNKMYRDAIKLDESGNTVIGCSNPYDSMFVNNDKEKIREIKSLTFFKERKPNKFFILPYGENFNDENGIPVVKRRGSKCSLSNSLPAEKRVEALESSVMILLADSKPNQKKKIYVNFAKHEKKEVREKMALGSAEKMYEYYAKQKGFGSSVEVTPNAEKEILKIIESKLKVEGYNSKDLAEKIKVEMSERRNSFNDGTGVLMKSENKDDFDSIMESILSNEKNKEEVVSNYLVSENGLSRNMLAKKINQLRGELTEEINHSEDVDYKRLNQAKLEDLNKFEKKIESEINNILKAQNNNLMPEITANNVGDQLISSEMAKEAIKKIKEKEIADKLKQEEKQSKKSKRSQKPKPQNGK